MKNKILIVDDEKDIVDMLQYNLEKEGYEVLSARNGKDALEQAQSHPDLIVLDVMMPEIDGWEVCKQLKKNEMTTAIPILFLTAKGSEIDEVIGLELGAEDYIIKPISIRVLLARIKAALRKYKTTRDNNYISDEIIRIDQLEINVDNYTVVLNGESVPFARKEFETLVHLAKHPGRVITREKLLNAVWGNNVVVIDRTVDVHIRKIREKLGRYGDYIETVKGVGYRFRA